MPKPNFDGRAHTPAFMTEAERVPNPLTQREY